MIKFPYFSRAGGDMLEILKDRHNGEPKYTLAGSIDEDTDLDRFVDSDAKRVHFFCQGVSRINSIGIRLWQRFFVEFRSRGGEVKFHELSPLLTRATSEIEEFIGTAEVESVCAPFFCRSCNIRTLGILSVSQIRESHNTIGSKPCSSCGQPADFDEIPSEYFDFINF